MAVTGNLDLNKTSATCTSTWTGTAHQATAVQTVYTYSTPTWDYDNVTITVPAGMVGAVFSSASLDYTGASASGTKAIKFADSGETCDNSALLARLQNGETTIKLSFQFRAAGGYGGAGSHSLTCYWQNLSVSVTYTPATGISGTATVGSSSIGYAVSHRSVALGESLEFTAIQVTAAQATASLAVDVREHGAADCVTGTYDWSGTAGAQPSRAVQVSFSGVTLSARVVYGDLRFRLTYSDGTVATSGWMTTTLRLVSSRVAPVLTAAWTDTSAQAQALGVYVQGISSLTAAITPALDTAADPDMALASRKLTINNASYASGDDMFEGIVPTSAGELAYTVTYTDTYGVSGTLTGKLTVYGYSAPSATLLNVQRYREKTDSKGETYYEQDDDGTDVWVNLSAAVSAVNGKNAYTVVAAVDGTSYSVKAGSDGETISLTDARGLITGTFDTASAYTVTLTITDTIGSATYTCVVDKSGAILDIETGGVAVGKRSTGTSAEPRFECAYPAYFEGAVYGSDGSELGGVRYVLPETRIGTYLGKALYRIGIELSEYSDDNGDPTDIDLGISPTRIINISGYVLTVSYGDLPVNCYHSNDIRAFIRPDGLTGHLLGYTGVANTGAVIFCEYTKD